jgi:hypothetical protein
MRWITDEDLKKWSRMTDARELFVDLVGDLIRATVSDISGFRFPGQSAGILRGFDGDLETTERVSRVPKGQSKWEFGTTSAGRGKAQEDYDKRTLQTPAEVMAENALVMLNLNSWDTPREPLPLWVAERQAEGKWREVHFIDGTALVHWLEEKPAVAAKYARTVLRNHPRNGALSTDEFWDLYSAGFRPALTEKMLLCEREKVAAQLLQVLTGPPQNFTLGADTAEEVIAFAVAAIRTAPEDVRRTLEANTMIVETAEAAQYLLEKKNMTFLIRNEAVPHGGLLGRIGPTVIAATGVQRKRANIVTLLRPSASTMAEALESMGLERQAGYELAKKCGRSLTILRRLHPASGVSEDAEWAGLASVLKPALLAGGWRADSEFDKEVVASLAGGTDYVSVEAPIRQTLTMSDPPFDNVDQVWQVRAPVDAFAYYGHLVDEDDLQRLRAAAIRVLGHQVVQPTAKETFSFDYRAPKDYSSWLRDGLAYTLRMFAVMPDIGGLKLNSRSPQQYVDEIIRALPDFTQNHSWILSLLPQLSAVAEAAPVPFLEALERTLGGRKNEALDFFQDDEKDDYISARTSAHIYVIWALEVIAWNPLHLPRATSVLGKLAAVDPLKGPGRGNHALDSLRRIFLPWAPNTDANLDQRFAAIDGLVKTLPDVAWQLLKLLMPRVYDSTIPTARPSLRDTTPLNLQHITFGLVWETEARVFDRAINLAKGNEGRVVLLVEHLGSLQPSNRLRLMQAFSDTLELQSQPEGGALWHRLGDFVASLETYPEAVWSLKADDLVRLKEILNRCRPSDSVALARHLFDGAIPRATTDFLAAEKHAVVVQASELKKIHEELGVHGLIRLAMSVKRPDQVGRALIKLELPYDDIAELVLQLLQEQGECYQVGCNISGGLREKEEDSWGSYFRVFLVARCKSPQDIAWLLSRWPNNAETWDFAKSLGPEVIDIYWREVGSPPMNGTSEEFNLAITELRRAGQSLKALSTLRIRENELDSATLLALLEESAPQIASGPGASTMLSYAIGEVFATLARREVAPLAVAKMEYLYLPLIEGNVKDLSIHALLAENPKEYVDILKNSFVSKDEVPNPNPSAEQLVRAKLSYRLLKSFHTVPGEKDGRIDALKLTSWVLDVRTLATNCGRGDIADEFIGQLLAHSTESDDTWPAPEIAVVLEEIASDIVERGIEIERINIRGVYVLERDEGGNQTRELATTYRKWSERATSPRTAAMLERIAKEYSDCAMREDIAAQQRNLKR